jgi:DNA-binding MarR family transcriptional regulator
MTPSSAQTLYHRFLKMAKSAYTSPYGVALSPLETILLQEIFLGAHEHKPLTVKEVLGFKHLGSPSTLHKKLAHLRALELLAVEHRGNDHRTKYLVLTPIALEHFDALGQALEKAMAMHTRAA